MNQDRPLTAMEWVEKYHHNQNPLKENPEAKAAFFRMDEEEKSILGGFVIYDSIMALKKTEAENRKNGNYTAQDTINLLQDEIAFLYLQCTQLHTFVCDLMAALARFEKSLAPEDIRKINLKMAHLRKLARLTEEEVDKHWIKDHGQWPSFLD